MFHVFRTYRCSTWEILQLTFEWAVQTYSGKIFLNFIIKFHTFFWKNNFNHPNKLFAIICSEYKMVYYWEIFVFGMVFFVYTMTYSFLNRFGHLDFDCLLFAAPRTRCYLYFDISGIIDHFGVDKSYRITNKNNRSDLCY